MKMKILPDTRGTQRTKLLKVHGIISEKISGVFRPLLVMEVEGGWGEGEEGR